MNATPSTTSRRLRRLLVGAALALSTPTFAGAPMKVTTSPEATARARYFAFELEPVQSEFKGDWAAFLAHQQAEEARLDEEARRTPPSSRYGAAPTGEQARALRALSAEFQQVAMRRTDEIRALARRVLTALRQGDVAAVVDDCAMYDATAPDRAALTLKWLAEHRAELMALAKLAPLEDARFGEALVFTSPSPSTGMTGQVSLYFGPTPKDDPQRTPYRHQLELWWSGEVMPEANAPLHARPAPKPPKSRWRFYALTAAQSRQQMYLQ